MEESWKIWSEAFVREVSQLRMDVNKHATENREDVTDIYKRLDNLLDLVHKLETDVMAADHETAMSIQELQLLAKSSGREAAKEETAKDRIYYVISGVIAIVLSTISFLKG